MRTSIVTERGERVLGRLAFALAVLAAAGPGAEAASGSKEAAHGYEAYEAERYDEAAKAYEQAIVAGVDDPEVRYNLGNARYKAAASDTTGVRDAFGEWQRAAASASGELRSNAIYNAGNASLRLGELEKAELLYKDALRQNPGDEDARYNLELVQRLMEEQAGQEGQENDDSSSDSPSPSDSSQAPSEEKSSTEPGGDSDRSREPNPSTDSKPPQGDSPQDELPPEAPEPPADEPEPASGSNPGDAPPTPGSEDAAGSEEPREVSMAEALRQLEMLEEAEREHLRQLLLLKRREIDVDKDW